MSLGKARKRGSGFRASFRDGTGKSHTSLLYVTIVKKPNCSSPLQKPKMSQPVCLTCPGSPFSIQPVWLASHSAHPEIHCLAHGSYSVWLEVSEENSPGRCQCGVDLCPYCWQHKDQSQHRLELVLLTPKSSLSVLQGVGGDTPVTVQFEPRFSDSRTVRDVTLVFTWQYIFSSNWL